MSPTVQYCRAHSITEERSTARDCNAFDGSGLLHVHGVPIFRRSQRSKPYQSATFYSSMSKIDSAKSSALVLAVPAIIKFQFMKPPAKAAMPTKAPRIRAMPIKISPHITRSANLVYQPRSSINWINARYQPKAIGGLPSADACTALSKCPYVVRPIQTFHH